MSCYVVTDSHITALTEYLVNSVKSYFYNGQRWEVKPENSRKLAQLLLNENYASVNHRYSENDTPHLYQRCKWAAGKNWQAIEIIKAAQCLDYQSCEHPGWKASEACAILQAIIETAIYKIPGWDGAPWGIDPAIEGRKVAR